MATFKDTKGREWKLCVSLQTVKEIQKKWKLNISQIVEADADVWKLLSNLEMFVDVIWLMVSKQAEEQDVTEHDFGEAMYGDEILDARTAFLKALVEFFPSQERRDAIKKMIQIAVDAESQIIQQARDELASIDSVELAKEVLKPVV